jgi:MFS family permease
MIVAAFLIGFCSGPGQSFCFSVFQPFLLESFDLTRGTFAGIYAAGSLISAMVASFAGRAADRFGIRWTLGVAAVVMAAACAGMALSAEWISLSISLAVLRALGQGTLVLLGSLLVVRWYVRRRGRAMSLAGLGIPVAGVLLPPACYHAIHAAGWRWTYAAMGGSLLVILLVLSVLVVRNSPEDVGQQADGTTAAAASNPPAANRRFLHTARFWILALVLASAPYVVTTLVFHQASLFEDRQLSSETAANMLSVLAVAAAATTLSIGSIVDRFGVRRVLRVLLVLQILCLVLAQALQAGWVVWSYTLLLGACAGGSGVMAGITWARFYGREGLGAVQGSAGTVMLTAAALAPLPLGYLRDWLGSNAVGLASCLILPVGGLVLLTRDIDPMDG